jgi:hypothetical protein
VSSFPKRTPSPGYCVPCNSRLTARGLRFVAAFDDVRCFSDAKTNNFCIIPESEMREKAFVSCIGSGEGSVLNR